MTRILADRPAAAAAAASRSHHGVPEAAVPDTSGGPDALLQAAAAVHLQLSISLMLHVMDLKLLLLGIALCC